MKRKLLQLAVLLAALGRVCAGDFEDRLNKGFWVRDYYNEVILTRDRNTILSYVPKYKENPSTFAYELDSEVYWYEESIFDKCEYGFSKIFYTYFLYVFSASFYITDIQRIDTDMYQVVVETDNFSKDEIEKSYNSGCDWQEENVIIERFYLKFDGDYLYVYLNEKTNLLATYCAYSESEYAWLNEAVATNDFDGMEFTFPRHADGSCDYDEGAWKAARKSGGVIPLRTGNAMTTEENLRVHAVEKTTSPVLITLAAGTPVEILGVGGEETIDGITSKWVHVKVMPGTTGTDGRHMTGTMGGWCFGGLVSATEKEPEPADAPATERAEYVEESAIQKPAPAVGKTAAVTENLRLRTDDDRTAEVVATLAAGTLVKILAVGRVDTIDDIASNWVRVSVLGGARDRDGNAVADGTCDYEDEGGNAAAASDFTQVEHYSDGILENDFYRNENLQYVTAESTKVYSNDWELVGTEKKNKTMENCSLTITLDHYVMIGKDNHWMNADDLYIRGSSLLPKEIVYDQIHPEYEWIPVWYNEVIKCQGADFKKEVYKYAPFLEGKWLPDSECWWYEDVTFSYPCVFRFQNTYLCLTTDGWGVQKFLIEKIIERNKSYYIHCKSIGFYYDEYKDNLCYFENFPRVNHGETFVLRLEQNGGHLFLYNDGTNKLIEELMPASRAWIKKLQEYFNTGINTFTPEDVSLLSRKTDAPTTADAPATERAESEEESATPKPAPAVGKTAAVTDNLRLRTDDRTTAEVVATLAAGTRVKVEATGREDAIDGILSNWVRVSVLGGVQDRDGNAVAAGTEGWLFGGYLSATEDAETQSPRGEAAAAKAPVPTIALVAAGGAVFVILLAAILLAVRKRKGGRSVIVEENDGNA